MHIKKILSIITRMCLTVTRHVVKPNLAGKFFKVFLYVQLSFSTSWCSWASYCFLSLYEFKLFSLLSAVKLLLSMLHLSFILRPFVNSVKLLHSLAQLSFCSCWCSCSWAFSLFVAVKLPLILVQFIMNFLRSSSWIVAEEEGRLF